VKLMSVYLNIFCLSAAAVCQRLANDGYDGKLTYSPCTLAVVSML
jgi:hypothetical protein